MRKEECSDMLLTVFTPAYNRAHTLGRTYNSLCKQSCKDFCWMIIDDGSTDNTAELVKEWTAEKDNGFRIFYYYKENGGLHTAYNTAIAHLQTELAVCIDSDDFMPENAIELIKDKWESEGSDQYAGILGLDYDINGNLICDLLPDKKEINLIDLNLGKEKIVGGDKKEVIRSDLYKSVAPMKSFPGEKNFNPFYMILEISRHYNFLILNKPLCIVEYQPEGMTAGIFKQYYNSPNSFLELRKQLFTFNDVPFTRKVRNMIHLVSSSILAHKYFQELLYSKYPFLMLLCSVPGIALCMLTVIKGRK